MCILGVSIHVSLCFSRYKCVCLSASSYCPLLVSYLQYSLCHHSQMNPSLSFLLRPREVQT